MISQEIADRYAQALLELGNEEDILEELAGDIMSLKKIFEESEDLVSFLEHPLIPDEDKQKIITEVVEEGVRRETLNFILLMIDHSREKYLKVVCDRFLDIKSDSQNLTKVKVFSALEEKEDEIEKMIKGKLEEALNTSIEVTEVEKDSNLLGGIKLEIAGKTIDGSASRQLKKLREHLTLGGINGSNK